MHSDIDRERVLTEDEHTTMKAALLRYAEDTLIREAPVLSPYPHAFRWAALSFMLLLIMTGGATYASTKSLPGEPLYALKVNVVEETVALTILDPNDRIAYELERMETRLAEIKSLKAMPEATDADALADVSAEINEHLETVTHAVTATNTALSQRERIEALSDLTTVTEAQEETSDDTPALAPLHATIDATNDRVRVLLDENIDALVDTSPEEARSYLSEKMGEISENLEAGDLEKTVRETSAQHVANIGEALVEGDTGEAIESVLEAERTIELDAYLDEDAD